MAAKRNSTMGMPTMVGRNDYDGDEMRMPHPTHPMRDTKGRLMAGAGFKGDRLGTAGRQTMATKAPALPKKPANVPAPTKSGNEQAGKRPAKSKSLWDSIPGWPGH